MLMPSDFRVPTEREAQGVANNMYQYYKGNMLRDKALGALFGVLGALAFIGGFDQPIEPFPMKLLTIILMTAFFGIPAALMFKDLHTTKAILNVYETGQFYVADGTVTKLEPFEERRTYFLVEFTALSGTVLEDKWIVPDKGVGIGTPLLFVYIDESFKSSVKHIELVYTPALLSGEVK